MDEMLRMYPGRIIIHSGEGTEGNYKIYRGARTARAIKARLTKERCGGDRWAHAYVCLHEDDISTYYGLDNDEQRHLSDADIDE